MIATSKMIFEDNRRRKKEPQYVSAKKQTKTKKKKRKKPYIVFMNLMCGSGVHNWKILGERIQQFLENFREIFLTNWTSSKVQIKSCFPK